MKCACRALITYLQQWQHTTSKPAIPHLDARFHKSPLETHVTGSTPHLNQPLPIYTLDFTGRSTRTSLAASHSPSRRSIRRAPTRDAHQWQHTTSKPAIPHLHARFHIRPLETQISGMTAHPKPAIPHLDARFHKHPLETNISGSTPHQNQPFPIYTLEFTSRSTRTSLAASHSPSRHSIRRAPTRDAHQWQHTTSKPAIPHLDARFHIRPLETHIGGMTAHPKPAILHLDARFHVEPSDRSRIKRDSLKAVPAFGQSSMRISTQRCEIKRLQGVIAVVVCMGLAILFRKVTLQEPACKMLSGVNGC